MPRPNYYADLGINETATDIEIRQAYRRLVLEHHPDKQTPGQTVDAAEFRKVQEAYEILRDPTTREQYDAGEDVSEYGDYGYYYYDDDDDYYDEWERELEEFLRRQARRAQAYAGTYGFSHGFPEYDDDDDEAEDADFAAWRAQREKASAEQRKAHAAQSKKQGIIDEEEARDERIKQEDSLHDKSQRKNNTRGKAKSSAPSRANCSCEGCRNRFLRLQFEKDQKKKDPEGYKERMRVREEITARKEKEAAEQARQEAKRQAAEQKAAAEAAAEAAAAKQKAKEQAAAEHAARELIRQQIAEQEAEKAAAEEEAKAKAAEEQKAKEAAAAEKKARKLAAAERKAAKEAAAEQRARDLAAAEKKAADEAAAEQKARKQAAAKQKAKEQAAARKKAKAAQIAEERAAAAAAAAAEEHAKALAAEEQRKKEEAAAQQAAAELKAKEEAAAQKTAKTPKTVERAKPDHEPESRASKLQRALEYIYDTKDEFLSTWEAQGRAIPADGVVVNLRWIWVGRQWKCWFCKRPNLQSAYRCPVGGAVACKECKTSLSLIKSEQPVAV